jgi:hypothetical protein
MNSNLALSQVTRCVLQWTGSPCKEFVRVVHHININKNLYTLNWKGRRKWLRERFISEAVPAPWCVRARNWSSAGAVSTLLPRTSCFWNVFRKFNFCSNRMTWAPNVVVKWLTLLLRVREISGSNPDPEAGCPAWDVWWFYSVTSGEFWDSTLNLATTACF